MFTITNIDKKIKAVDLLIEEESKKLMLLEKEGEYLEKQLQAEELKLKNQKLKEQIKKYQEK